MNLQKIKETVIAFAKKAWAYIKLARLELIILAALFIVDLVSKQIVASTMREGQVITLIPKFLNFRFVYNELAAFGSAFGLENLIGQTAIRVIFIIITFIALGVFCYFLYRNRGKSKMMRVSLAMIIAGALGNLVDRLFIGKVRDFVEIVFFGCDVPLLGESFAIFNIADAALVIGVILFLIYFIFLYKDTDKKEKNVVPDVEMYDSTQTAPDAETDEPSEKQQPAPEDPADDASAAPAQPTDSVPAAPAQPTDEAEENA